MRKSVRRGPGWAAAAVVAVAAIWLTANGIRFDQLVPDPFAGFTRHQWGALLGGLIGAGLSAGIALMVLRRTLSVQTRQFRASQEAAEDALREQLAAQRRALDEQLAAQTETLEEQLAHQAQAVRTQLDAQSKEASKQRELSARADILAISEELWSWVLHGLDPGAEKNQRASVAIHRWRFELDDAQDSRLLSELEAWRPWLVRVFGAGRERHVQGDTGFVQALERTVGKFENVAANYGRQVNGALWDSDMCGELLMHARLEGLQFYFNVFPNSPEAGLPYGDSPNRVVGS